MRIWVTRPKEDSESLISRLHDMGHQAYEAALLEIHYEDQMDESFAPFAENDIQALLVTSANGIRAFANLDERRDLKVLCVGDASARTSRGLGFSDVISANGDVNSLAELIKKTCDPTTGILLHVAGSRLAGDLKSQLTPSGYEYVRIVLYHAKKAEQLDDFVLSALKDRTIDGICLFSPRTAQTFRALVTKYQLQDYIKHINLYALSKAVVEELDGLSLGAVYIADEPTQQSLLDSIQSSGDMKMTNHKDENPSSQNQETEKMKMKEDEIIDVEVSEIVEEGKEDPAQQTPDNEDAELLTETEAKQKLSFKTKALLAGAIIITGVVGTVYGTKNVWLPPLEMKIADALQIEQSLPDDLLKRLEENEKRLAALESKSSDVVPQGFDINEEITPILNQITDLQTQMTALNDQLSLIDIANAENGSLVNIDELKGQIANLSSVTKEDWQAVKEENAALNQTLEDFKARLVAIETQKVSVRDQDNTVHAMMAALSHLRETARTSQRFEDELRSLEALSVNDEDLKTLLQQVAPFAKEGVASNSALRTEFEETATKIVKAIAVPEGSGWFEETVANLSSLVTIRRAPDNLEGEGTLALVARAEHNVRNGDFDAAVKILKTLEGKPREVAQSWIDIVEKRFEADKLFNQIQTHVLAMLGAIGGE